MEVPAEPPKWHCIAPPFVLQREAVLLAKPPASSTHPTILLCEQC
jgi:hypothetical protein